MTGNHTNSKFGHRSMTVIGALQRSGANFQMTRTLRITFVVLVILSAGIIFIMECSPPDPVVQGKRVSVWHKQLCYGVYGGRSKTDDRLFDEAYDAFRQMGPEAVPYLTAELRYLRSERLEQAFRWAMRRPMIRPLLQN